MQGLGMNTPSVTYLQIRGGKIVRPVKEPTEKSVSRENKAKKIVHEEFYDNITGVITAVETKQSEYGKFWVVKLDVNGKKYNVEFNYSGGYASTFLKALPNIDLTLPVTIIPNQQIVDEKTKAVIFLNQGGKAIKHFFTKDNPNGMPSLKKTKHKGVEVWDDTEQMDFLEAYVQKLFHGGKVEEEAPF